MLWKNSVLPIKICNMCRIMINIHQHTYHRIRYVGYYIISVYG